MRIAIFIAIVKLQIEWYHLKMLLIKENDTFFFPKIQNEHDDSVPCFFMCKPPVIHN